MRFRSKVRSVLHEVLPAYRAARHRKPLLQQVGELIRLGLKYRFVPYHYYLYGHYEPGHPHDYLDFVPPRLIMRHRDAINPATYTCLTRDKWFFDKAMTAAGLPVVPTLFRVDQSGEIFERRGQRLTFDEMIAVLNREGFRSVFVKPSWGAEGTNVHRLDVTERGFLFDGKRCDSIAALLPLLFTVPGLDRYLIQPVIEQHPLLSAMNPSSVNTIRIDSFVTHSGEVVSCGAALRVGGKDSIVDNSARGGLNVRIDVANGALEPGGKQALPIGDGPLLAHPHTGFRFEGVVLPFWKELWEVVRAGARALQPLRSLGWDIAITPDGPVIIEANDDFNIIWMQYDAGGLMRHELGQEMSRSFGW